MAICGYICQHTGEVCEYSVYGGNCQFSICVKGQPTETVFYMSNDKKQGITECCINCKNWMELVMFDYQHGGCEHHNMGHACTLFANDGRIVWMVGNDPTVEQCEGFVPKEG